ncbi:MAG: nuclear transport factor 2 family protein, partial [Bacteroidota bacterium]
NINPSVFADRDAQIEDVFTSKQPGFIKRQSGIDDKGNYLVLTYWQSTADADASMNKFMSDASVADYAQMIDGATMKMNRYVLGQAFKAEDSKFVEVMAFEIHPSTDLEAFDALNQRVETEFTGKRKGFRQRLTGMNEAGRQVVAVYWADKTTSDTSLEPFMAAPIAQTFMAEMDQASIVMGRYQLLNIPLSKKEKAVALLNSFNTGDQTPIAYINPNKYIQHNLAVADGLAGFGEVMQHEPPQGFKANVIRAFEDGDFVFTHTEYDLFGPKAGFDVFRFEDDLIVEHWDNLTEVVAQTASGRSQFDGPTNSTDLDKTAKNKAIIADFYETVLIGGDFNSLPNFFDGDTYLQHNPMLPDGVSGFLEGVQKMAESGITMNLDKVHLILGEGNYVLGLSEGTLGGKPYAYYDLFRMENGKIAEHWDVMAEIPPQSEWKNNNGKF